MTGQEEDDHETERETGNLHDVSERSHNQTLPVTAKRNVCSAATGEGTDTKAKTQQTKRNVNTDPTT